MQGVAHSARGRWDCTWAILGLNAFHNAVGRKTHPAILGLSQNRLDANMGLSKNPDINQMLFFKNFIVFFLLSFFQVLASHLHQAIHIVVPLWNVSLQPQALHMSLFSNLVPAKLRFSLDIRKKTCKVYTKRYVNHQKWAVSHTDHF